jgi:hypothetical protein
MMPASFQHFFLHGKLSGRAITRWKPKGEFALMPRPAMGGRNGGRELMNGD